MFFTEAKKKIAGSIVDHFDSKFPREKSGKMEFKEAKGSADTEGDAGEAHQQALEAHSEAMHEASKTGDHAAHAKALKSFIEEVHAHKDVDYGHPSDEKDSKHVAIVGDEYK
jgi:hypothetical protein